ncbi:hypothetical protein DCC39_02580 [Pueribacillus theae]|uniref:P21 n=1 Tax=Pueribacillus theae TaxID=2171751 RepID=A0A2U1K707_9BACI|nr:DUF6230 family protein [Pueribacillus theae]PWA13035.1 hypothetical protein DCC39_02580 [Pueribacillus theae]
MVDALNVNKKRLGIIGGAGGAGLIALLLSLFLTGSAFAAFPIAGVGGFVIAADKIEGTDFKLYPQLGETEKKAAWGQAAVELGTAKINGLKLSKNIDLQGALDAYNVETVDVMVTSGAGVDGKDLKLRVTGIKSENSTFTNLEVAEHYTDNPLKSIDLKAPTLVLDKPELNTHFLSASNIGIPGLKVKIIANMKDGKKIGDF